MDFTKLGSNNWSEPGKLQETTATASQSVTSFIHDMNQHAVATTMVDLLQASKARRATSDNILSQRKTKNISLSATAPVHLLPSLKAGTSNLSKTAVGSPINGTYGYTSHVGKIRF